MNRTHEIKMVAVGWIVGVLLFTSCVYAVQKTVENDSPYHNKVEE
jgi:hypothetical protein